ncbi:hypothetical protein DM02DRAFT_678972 [Periconia macrospinosa]|uniref:Uncharacterized protein n=1 Tax=Periconia macrospinosa TaxID=97972 RepID=A0A2V1ECK9_9PLEO|nr:hypothetical protein DM02DRAFT_678972 [Periconia macrospinosa]
MANNMQDMTNMDTPVNQQTPQQQQQQPFPQTQQQQQLFAAMHPFAQYEQPNQQQPQQQQQLASAMNPFGQYMQTNQQQPQQQQQLSSVYMQLNQQQPQQQQQQQPQQQQQQQQQLQQQQLQQLQQSGYNARYPPATYLPPPGVYYDPNHEIINKMLPTNIEKRGALDPSCGRCFRPRSDHPPGQKEFWLCQRKCGFCGQTHPLNTSCPKLYASAKWLKDKQRYSDDRLDALAGNTQIQIRPTGDHVVVLQQAGYIWPGANRPLGQLPAFTPAAWALRPPCAQSVPATTIYRPSQDRIPQNNQSNTVGGRPQNKGISKRKNNPRSQRDSSQRLPSSYDPQFPPSQQHPSQMRPPSYGRQSPLSVQPLESSYGSQPVPTHFNLPPQSPYQNAMAPPLQSPYQIAMAPPPQSPYHNTMALPQNPYPTSMAPPQQPVMAPQTPQFTPAIPSSAAPSVSSSDPRFDELDEKPKALDKLIAKATLP